MRIVNAGFKEVIKCIQDILEYWNLKRFIEGFYFRELKMDIFYFKTSR